MRSPLYGDFGPEATPGAAALDRRAASGLNLKANESVL